MSTDDRNPAEAEALMRRQRRVEEGEPIASDEMRIWTTEIRAKFVGLEQVSPGLQSHIYSIARFIGNYFTDGNIDRKIHVEGIPMQIVLALSDLQAGVSYGKHITSRAAGLHPSMYKLFLDLLIPQILPRLFTQEQVAAMVPLFGPSLFGASE
jgi:hypothetical protein